MRRFLHLTSGPQVATATAAIYLWLSLPASASDVAVFTAARDDWQERLSFVCTYEHFRGYAENEADALAGRASAGPFLREKRGVIAKRGRQLKNTCYWDASPVAEGEGRISNASYETTSTNDLDAWYYPTQAVKTAEARVALRHASDQEYGAPFGRIDIFPFSPISSSGANPIRIFDHPDGKPKLAESSAIDGTHVEVHVVRDIEDVEQHLWVRFWTEPSPPVIDRMRMEDRFVKSNQPPTPSAWLLSDFVDSGGLMVAKTVRVTCPAGKSNRWLLLEWRSRDLGERLPTDEDFVIRVKAGVPVSGLIKPPPKDEEKRIDLMSLSAADLIPEFNPLPPEPNQGWKLWMGIGLAGLAVAALSLWLRRRRTRQYRYA